MKKFLPILMLYAAITRGDKIDFFNESIEVVGAHPSAEITKAPPNTLGDGAGSWGQVNSTGDAAPTFVGPLGTSAIEAPPAPTLVVPSAITLPAPKPKGYLKEKLKQKELEISKTRQHVLGTENGSHLRALSGNLTRLEAERQQLLNSVQSGPSPQNVSGGGVVPILNEEDTLKLQLSNLDKQQAMVRQQIQKAADANILSPLSATLERLQHNRKLVELSLEYVQKKKAKANRIGFNPNLLPPPSPSSVTPLAPGVIPSLTPSLESYVVPAANMTSPAPSATGVQPSLTPQDWQKMAGNKDASPPAATEKHLSAPKHPLWTPPDPFGDKRMYKVKNHAPVDHMAIIAKIRGQRH